jgi:2-keto-4-pentenoate hydratase/2-oxohepta-3-ene-1,7-dioic acid hydratase in catechol pathway
VKFVRFVDAKHERGVCGIVREDGAIEILAGGMLDPVERTGEVVQESSIVRYLPPVDAPNIIAIGMNYPMHVSENKETPPERPLVFLKATTSLSAHKADILLAKAAPAHSDWEAEMVAIIGRKARCVSVENALDYVFGYTCGNDVSARDCQAMDGQWARGKSFDTFAPMGPYVATGIDPQNLQLTMRLNGTVMQNDSTKNMFFSVAFLVSYLSQVMTLVPGTAIMTGTPGGVGNARKPPILLKPGDVCEVELSGIGVLENRCVLEK